MTLELNAELYTVPGKFLTQVLEQSEHIHAIIKRSTEELAAVNTEARHQLARSDSAPGVSTALEKHEAVTEQLQNASERLAAVNRALLIEVRDRTLVDHQLAAAVEQEEGSRKAALHDPLTGLPNRVLFKDRLEHGIAQAMRHRWTLAVMFVDLDNFKGINDSYGHQAGDAVLQTVALRLDQNTRNEDTVSRYGGDEFLYLVSPFDDQKDIARIAAKILKAIQAPCEVHVSDAVVRLCPEASIGISVFPKDGSTAAALIQRADEAMYGAKVERTGFAFAQ
jgi:diguanylate cyclase (GGDEF)-like protein